jgi:hypothetical protein
MNNLLYNTKQIFKEGPLGIYLMAFLIPLYAKWLGFAVLIIILEQIIRRTPVRITDIKTQLTWRNPGVWLFLFYLMHVVGLIHTENMAFANMDLGMKSTIAIFPVFFMLYQPVVRWAVFTKFFVFGAFVSIVYNVSANLGIYLETNNIYFMTGSGLSSLMHRGYWAVYLLVAYFFLIKMTFQTKSKKQMLVNFFGALVMAFFIILSESRLGLIGLVLISAWEVIKLARAFKSKWIIPVAAALFLGMVLLVYNFMPRVVNRVSTTIETVLQPIDSNSDEKAIERSARSYLWGSSIELIKENFWFGVGTGDVKDVFVQRNSEKGYSRFVELRLNSHNQFFNSHIALGVFGSLFLLLSIVTNLMRQKSDPLRSWRTGIVFVLFLAMLPESMLESQAGIIPYAFLLSFLTAFKLKQ